MSTTEATATRTLEEVVRGTLAGIEEAEKRYRRMAVKVDRRDGAGKRAYDRLIRAAQDYNLQGQGLRLALGTWEREASMKEEERS